MGWGSPASWQSVTAASRALPRLPERRAGDNSRLESPEGAPVPPQGEQSSFTAVPAGSGYSGMALIWKRIHAGDLQPGRDGAAPLGESPHSGAIPRGWKEGRGSLSRGNNLECAIHQPKLLRPAGAGTACAVLPCPGEAGMWNPGTLWECETLRMGQLSSQRCRGVQDADL